jgi:hypothetical protein
VGVAAVLNVEQARALLRAPLERLRAKRR